MAIFERFKRKGKTSEVEARADAAPARNPSKPPPSKTRQIAIDSDGAPLDPRLTTASTRVGLPPSFFDTEPGSDPGQDANGAATTRLVDTGETRVMRATGERPAAPSTGPTRLVDASQAGGDAAAETKVASPGPTASAQTRVWTQPPEPAEELSQHRPAQSAPDPAATRVGPPPVEWPQPVMDAEPQPQPQPCDTEAIDPPQEPEAAALPGEAVTRIGAAPDLPNAAEEVPAERHPEPKEPTDSRTHIVDTGSIFLGRLVGVLAAVEGEFEGEIYKVREGENEIGRGKGCSVKLASNYISREHAMLTYRERQFELCALSDGNPTLLNGRAVVDPTPLSDGDSIQVGRTRLLFRSVV